MDCSNKLSSPLFLPSLPCIFSPPSHIHLGLGPILSHLTSSSIFSSSPSSLFSPDFPFISSLPASPHTASPSAAVTENPNKWCNPRATVPYYPPPSSSLSVYGTAKTLPPVRNPAQPSRADPVSLLQAAAQ